MATKKKKTTQRRFTTHDGIEVTLRALAKVTRVSHAYLSLALHGKVRIRREVAQAIYLIVPELTVTEKTWPRGFVA